MFSPYSLKIDWGLIGADPEELDSHGLTAFHVGLQHGHISVLNYFFDAHPPNDLDTKAIYTAPETKTLLSLALESREPEVVWTVLDKQLASTVDISKAWTWITSSEGKSFMRKKASGKPSPQDVEKLDDIMKLLMRFGGFTPPPTPSSSDRGDKEDAWRPGGMMNGDEQHSGWNRPPLEQIPSQSNGVPAQQQHKHSSGRGRGRGRARGRGRSRGF